MRLPALESLRWHLLRCPPYCRSGRARSCNSTVSTVPLPLPSAARGAAMLPATPGRSPCRVNGPDYLSELQSLAAQIQWNLVGARLNGGSQVGGFQTAVFFRCHQTADRWSLSGRWRRIVSSDDSDSIFSRLKPLLAAGAEFVGSVVSNHPIHCRPTPYRMKRHHAAAERLCVKQNASCDKRIVLAATSNDAYDNCRERQW